MQLTLEQAATRLGKSVMPTYLGFRISRAGLLPGPKAKKRLQQRLRKATLTNPDQLARSLRAYQGMLLTIG